MADVANRDFAQYNDTYNLADFPISVTLRNTISIVAFSLKDATGANNITKTITKMRIYDKKNNFTYNITPQNLDTIYVALWPNSGEDIVISATNGPKDYMKIVSGKDYQSNNFYQQGLRMEQLKLLSDATADDYGKVVCAAGHLHAAKTAVPIVCTPVGILGKVTGTGHGLILSLYDVSRTDWNTINNWSSVTSYANTTLKQLSEKSRSASGLTSFTNLGRTNASVMQ